MKFKDGLKQAMVEDSVERFKKCRDEYKANCCTYFHIDQFGQLIAQMYYADELFKVEQIANGIAKYFKEEGCDYLIYINDQPFDEKGFFVEEG